MRLLLFLCVYWQIYATIYSWKFGLGRSHWRKLGAPKGADTSPLPVELWFSQKLNHFSPQDTRTWKQRYYVNEEFYDPNDESSPVFLMIGGEGPADPRWMVKGAWIEYAKRLNALCIMVEHRYYGMSHPLPDMSVKNLQYLSSRQALADLANFIETYNEKYHFKNRKWIMFGGSYPGSLAAWMRLKYPHLVYASVSSSGPLEAVMDFQDYYRVVVNALIEKTGKQQCVDQVQLAHKQITTLMKLEPHTVETIFKLCKPLGDASVQDIKNFYESIADFFAGVVQYNEDNRIVNNTDRTNVTINTVCNMLTAPGDQAFKNLGGVARMLLDLDKQPCLNYSYADAIRELRQDQWSPEPASERQWFYQTCTEFGFYQTSTGESDVFGDDFDLEYFTRQCSDVFGQKFNDDFIRDAVNATNRYYGGRDIKATRVLYVHGSVDPWHALGLTKATDSSSPVIYIRGTAHCANMYPSADTDLPALKEARETIYNQLWLWKHQ